MKTFKEFMNEKDAEKTLYIDMDKFNDVNESDNLSTEEYLKLVDTLRKENKDKWVNFTQKVNQHEVGIKFYNTWIQRGTIDGTNAFGTPMEAKVSAFKDELKRAMDKLNTPVKVNEENLKTFSAKFTGRSNYSIDTTGKIECEVKASNEEEAELKLYNNYEHITDLKIKEIK